MIRLVVCVVVMMSMMASHCWNAVSRSFYFLIFLKQNNNMQSVYEEKNNLFFFRRDVCYDVCMYLDKQNT